MQWPDDEKPGRQCAAARVHLDYVADHAAGTFGSDSESVESFEASGRFEAEPDGFSRNPGLHAIADRPVPAACANPERAIEAGRRPPTRPETIIVRTEGIEQFSDRMRWRGEAPLVYVRNAHTRTIIPQPG